MSKQEVKSHHISKAKFVIQTSTNGRMKQFGGPKSNPDYTTNEANINLLGSFASIALEEAFLPWE